MKIILVTGATGMVGKATTRLLTERGHSVIRVVRNVEKADSNSDSSSNVVCPDLLADGAVSHLLENLRSVTNTVDAFIHLARDRKNLNGPLSSRQNWLNEYELATYVPFTLGSALFESFGLRKMVVGSSIYGVVAQQPEMYASKEALNVHYGCARAGVIQMVRDLSVQWAPQCSVNAVSLGGVRDGTLGEVERAYGARSPAGEMLTPQEAAGALALLVSEDSAAITGHNLVADGGWTAW